jgi:hypothetical protein
MFVGSRSVLNACDHHVENPITGDRRVPSTFPKKAGESVYVHPTAISNFLERYLPNVQFPIILVSGDSDMTIPDDLNRFHVRYILSHPMILAWYSQNCTQPSEKLRQLPIGLDFHTLALNAGHEWGETRSVELQESDVIEVLNSVPPSARENKCYANFQFLMNTRYAQDRRDAIQKVPKDLVYYQPTKVKRMESWKTMVKYKYVLSPQGNGIDCHRTWEALALGCIPIVKTSQLDPMFEGLPVMIVKDWRDITKEMLESYDPSKKTLDKLTLAFWKQRLSL